MTALTGQEILYVLGSYNGATPSGTTQVTTTAQIAALGGGGGITPGPATPVLSGTSYTTIPLADIFIYWNSAVLAPKTTIITTTGLVAGQVITVKDRKQNANTYPITLVAAEGGVTIDDAATYIMNYSGEAVSLKWDGVANLMVF